MRGINIDQKGLGKAAQDLGLELVLLHGSMTEGKTHQESDVDLAIEFGSDEYDLLEVYKRLSSVFGTDKLDIVDLKRANPLLLKSVTDKAKVLYGEEDRLNKLQLKALHLYNDFKPYLQMEAEFNRQQLENI